MRPVVNAASGGGDRSAVRARGALEEHTAEGGPGPERRRFIRFAEGLVVQSERLGMTLENALLEVRALAYLRRRRILRALEERKRLSEERMARETARRLERESFERDISSAVRARSTSPLPPSAFRSISSAASRDLMRAEPMKTTVSSTR